MNWFEACGWDSLQDAAAMRYESHLQRHVAADLWCSGSGKKKATTISSILGWKAWDTSSEFWRQWHLQSAGMHNSISAALQSECQAKFAGPGGMLYNEFS